MVTDEMLDAIDMLIEICSNEEQVLGMKSVREMLADFDEQGWLCMDRPSDCYEWLEQFLSCERKVIVKAAEEKACLNCNYYDLSREEIKEPEGVTGYKVHGII